MATASARARDFDPRYLGYFECFNRQRYFEAHEVLEALWLQDRGPRRNFYKALIQVAAVFLKLEQGKLDAAQRLARRARGHLEPYRPTCAGLDVDEVCEWLTAVLRGAPPWTPATPPVLKVNPRCA